MPLMMLCSLGMGSAIAHAESITLSPGMKFSGSAVIKAGAYHLVDPGMGIVLVTGSGFTIDFHGAKIVGPGTDQGIGIHITDARNVTIKNADVSGCLWGILVERSTGVRLLDCVASRNADLPPGTVIDESGREPEDNHGGGILLRDSRNCLFQRCTAQYQWDGIDVVRSGQNTIEDGDCSYNGNWGLHLWNSSRNRFRRNRAIWCTTGAGTLFQALTGWQTYDSQAVGIDHNSNENQIEENDLRFGGDGIFIRANEGPIAPGTVVPPRNGSLRNVLRNNDCSFSPNNAIEVDLVDDTVIEGNNCSNSNYGMWLGYSRRCQVRRNICINDSSHAVEIENGQGDHFEANVFGFDTTQPSGKALIYLRQNGRDPTPSGPYTLWNNLFYGTAQPILLRKTTAEVSGNCIFSTNATDTRIVTADPESRVTLGANTLGKPETPLLPQITTQGTLTLKANSQNRLTGVRLDAGPIPTVIEIDHIPVWVRKKDKGQITFWMPVDFWDRPQPTTAELRVITANGISHPGLVMISWPEHWPRISSLTPNPAQIGDKLTITGADLIDPNAARRTHVLLNGKPVETIQASPQALIVTLPEGILVPTRYNMLVVRGEGANSQRIGPVTFAVDVPQARMPHLVSAIFAPTTLNVGDLLKVTMVVRNNLTIPAPLMTRPAPPYTYDEKRAFWENGLQEEPGTLHLRITSDHPGTHDPGSWPWLFGFSQSHLAPGETTNVTGFIRVETPGEQEFRVGLVAGGFRFIDDNAFRTRIIVRPRP